MHIFIYRDMRMRFNTIWSTHHVNRHNRLPGYAEQRVQHKINFNCSALLLHCEGFVGLGGHDKGGKLDSSFRFVTYNTFQREQRVLLVYRHVGMRMHVLTMIFPLPLPCHCYVFKYMWDHSTPIHYYCWYKYYWDWMEWLWHSSDENEWAFACGTFATESVSLVGGLSITACTRHFT